MMEKLNIRRASLKAALRGRKRTFAAWTSLGHPSITEMFSRSGVDFVGIDIEHSTISQEQSQRIIAASQAEGSLCLPRIATHNEEMIKRLLDSGADGIIAPTVNTAEQAEALASWMKYPPKGRRGFGIARGQGYGFDFNEYTENWNDISSLIVQIESIEAVDNIESILAVEDVDAVMVGPYDMSGSLGIPGQIDHPKVQEAAQRVVDACKKAGKGCGTQVVSPDPENVSTAFANGFTFVVLSSDIFLLWKWAEGMNGLISECR